MLVKSFWMAAVTLFLSGCVTTEGVSKKADAWIGADADTLVKYWGPPQRQYENQNGTKTFFYSSSETQVYSVQNNYADPSKGSSIHSATGGCSITFTVDSSNRIASTYWRGKLWKCNKEIIPGPNYAD